MRGSRHVPGRARDRRVDSPRVMGGPSQVIQQSPGRGERCRTRASSASLRTERARSSDATLTRSCATLCEVGRARRPASRRDGQPRAMCPSGPGCATPRRRRDPRGDMPQFRATEVCQHLVHVPSTSGGDLFSTDTRQGIVTHADSECVRVHLSRPAGAPTPAGEVAALSTQCRAHTGEVQIPRGARRIDAAGMYMIPGLWDSHVHLLGVGGF